MKGSASRQTRFVDACSINCRTVLKGMVPSMVGKCLYYAHDVQATHINCIHLVQELNSKGYPQQWWLPTLRGRLTSQGFRPCTVNHIVSTALSG